MFDPKDYDGITYEAEAREERARAEAQAQEDEEETDRQMAFVETPFCDADCFVNSIHSAACSAATSNPVHAALSGWVSAMRRAA